MTADAFALPWPGEGGLFSERHRHDCLHARLPSIMSAKSSSGLRRRLAQAGLRLGGADGARKWPSRPRQNVALGPGLYGRNININMKRSAALSISRRAPRSAVMK